MAGYPHVGDSNVPPSLRMSDTAYADGTMDASLPYDVKELCSIRNGVCMLVWMMLQNLDYRTPSACTKTSALLTKPAPFIPHYLLITNTVTTFPYRFALMFDGGSPGMN